MDWLKVFISFQSSVMLNTYINAVLPLTKQADGKYIYDEVVQNIGPNYFAIRDTASTPYSFPSRGIVPTIRTMSSADFPNMMGPSNNPALSSRRGDGDVPADQYRLVEVAGMPHNSIFSNTYASSATDLAKIGYKITASDVTFSYASTKSTNDFPAQYFYRGAEADIVKWVRNGIKPPYAPRITYSPMHGTEEIEYLEDQYGNTVGGLRNHWVDFPTGAYIPHSYNDPVVSGSGQFTRNYKIPFAADKIHQLYGTKSNLMRQYYQGIDQPVAGRWITPEDAVLAKNDIATSLLNWKYAFMAFPGAK